VLILAKVNPLVVPKALLESSLWDEEIAVTVSVLLSEKNQLDAPETLNCVGPPLVNNPNPNNWASAEEETIVDPPATLL
jgi:hypothetical protein